jgi:hypothetical protein
VVESACAAEAAVQTFHAAATVDEATVVRASEPAVVESVCAMDASVEATAEAVATGNEATDGSASEPAVVESADAAPATTLVDPFVSPPAAQLTIPKSAQEQVVAGPHADQARDSTSEHEGGAVLSPMAAPSGFVRRLKSIAWPLFLVAAVVLCGILALQATEQARQALSSWSLFGAPSQQMPETAQRWSRPKPDAATHSLLADLYGRSVVASWPVCDKSASPLSVAGKTPVQPPAKLSVVLRVELEILRHGRRVWIGKVAPETTFYGTLFILTQVARLVGI